MIEGEAKRCVTLRVGDHVYVHECAGRAVQRPGVISRPADRGFWVQLRKRAQDDRAHAYPVDDAHGRALQVEVVPGECSAIRVEDTADELAVLRELERLARANQWGKKNVAPVLGRLDALRGGR